MKSGQEEARQLKVPCHEMLFFIERGPYIYTANGVDGDVKSGQNDLAQLNLEAGQDFKASCCSSFST